MIDVQRSTLLQFNALKKSGKPIDGHFTVISGLFIGDQLVSLATGLSCLNHLQQSAHLDTGDVVNDCHAEVLCIRSFRALLYHQMISAVKMQESILDFDPQAIYPFKLKKGLDVRLYISQAPCGDASMDILEDRQSQMEVQRNSTHIQDQNYNLGQLLPYADINGLVQRGRMNLSLRGAARTKPGRIDCIPTLSMSCRDKILLWNLVGISGALLSHLIEPIYLSSITIADGYNKQVLEESFNHKMADIALPNPYKPAYPSFYSCKPEYKFRWSPDRSIPCPSCIIWNTIDGSQVLDMRGMKQGVSLKDSTKCRPFICNLELFFRFSKIIEFLNHEKLSSIPQIYKAMEGKADYFKLKKLNARYQETKEIGIDHVIKGWIRKRVNHCKMNLTK